MDPNANLLEQRRLAAQIIALQDKGDDANLAEIAYLGGRLAELVQEADGGLTV